MSRAVRGEHQELLSSLEPLAQIADSLDAIESDDLRDRLRDVVALLYTNLWSHLAAEDRVLYPAFDRIAKGSDVTKSMAADNVEIRGRIDRLSATANALGAEGTSLERCGDLQAEIWGLLAILRLHLEKEEQLVLPGLDDGLRPEEAMLLLGQLHVSVSMSDRLDPSAAKLYEHLTKHLANERFVLDGYNELVSRYDRSTYVGYLLTLVVDDEQRHHRLFSELIHTIERDPQHDAGAIVPASTQLMAQADELHAAIERYLEFERQDQAELDDLAKVLRREGADPMWLLLVEVMQRDTNKHISILDFLREHVPSPEQQPRPHGLWRR